MFGSIIRSFAAHRIATAIIYFCAVLLAARWLPIEPYGIILQALFLAKFMQITNLGAVNGYFVSRYSKVGPLAGAGPELEAQFVLALIVHFLIFGAGFALFAVLWHPNYLPGALIFLLFVPIYASEPVFRDRRWFFVSLLPDLSMATVLLALCVLSWVTDDVSADAPMLFVAGLALLVLPVWGILARRLVRWQVSLPERPLAATDLFSLLRIGRPVYFGTASFMLASSADRLLFPIHGTNEEVARYFLGYQLAMGAMMFVSALNFTNVVDLGHVHQQNRGLDRGTVLGTLRQAVLITTASVALLIIVVWLLETRFLDPVTYAGLLSLSLPLAMGFSVFYVAGTITPLLAYLKRQMPITFLMAGVALILWANNVLALWAGFGAFWLASITAAGFAVYGIVAVAYTLRQVSLA